MRTLIRWSSGDVSSLLKLPGQRYVLRIHPILSAAAHVGKGVQMSSSTFRPPPPPHWDPPICMRTHSELASCTFKRFACWHARAVMPRQCVCEHRASASWTRTQMHLAPAGSRPS